MPDELSTRPALSKLWEALERFAKAALDETGLLDPVGLLEDDDHELVLLTPFQVFEQVKGFPPSVRVRMVQDLIVRRERPPLRAGILYGAELVPVEGGDGETALIAWLEERSGFAARVVTSCEIKDDAVVLGERRIHPVKPILFTNDGDGGADVGRGRVGRLDIRPRTNFRVDPDLTIDQAADLFRLLALDPDSKDEDWRAVAQLGIDQQRFWFERACLRTAAVVISLIHVESESLRHDVEASFWNRMDVVSRHLNVESQHYFEAFRQSEQAKDSKVFSLFAQRCGGAQHAELVAFAHRAFVTLMAACRRWLKKHGIKP